jgi:hypothetical protein
MHWLHENWQIDFSARAAELLERDPSPHRTRRIRKRAENLYEMGCGAWRIWYRLLDTQVIICEIAPGYPEQTLTGEYREEVPDCDAQMAFLIQWPLSADVSSRLMM